MRYYKIGYWSMEECPHEILTHELDYTTEQFKDLCAQVFASKFNLRSFKESVSDTLDDVIETLKTDYGFKSIEVSAEFEPFGWCNMSSNLDWEDSQNEDNNLIKKHIFKSLIIR